MRVVLQHQPFGASSRFTVWEKGKGAEAARHDSYEEALRDAASRGAHRIHEMNSMGRYFASRFVHLSIGDRQYAAGAHYG